MFGASRKDSAFFDAFAAHAQKSHEAARTLVTMFEKLRASEGTSAYRLSDSEERQDPELATLAKAIKEAETAGDSITHDTMKRLHENWLTPLDREDIHQLASRLDDILDEIEAASDRIVLFEIRCAPPEARELAEAVVQSCAALVKAVDLLRTMGKAKEILELCVEVNRLENVADQAHRRAIAGLFAAGNDPFLVMKWRDVFESLESAADRCEDVADVIEGVVLEYA